MGGRGFQNREKAGAKAQRWCGRQYPRDGGACNDWFLWVVGPGVVGRMMVIFLN